MNLRCSQLPTFLACNQSAVHAPGEVRVEPEGDGTAELGTAVHAVMAEVVEKGLDEIPEIAPFATKYDVDVDELERLAVYGMRAWRELRQYFASPAVEVQLGDEELSGHADVLERGEERIVGLDWKSGYVERHHEPQVKGYAALSMDGAGVPVTFFIVYLRLGFFETYTWTAGELAVFRSDIAEAAFSPDPVFHPGEQCTFCPRRFTCPGRMAMVRRTALEVTDEEYQVLSPDRLLDLHRRVKAVAKSIDDWDRWIREYIRINGSIQIDGRVLGFVEENRDTIDPITAWPVLSATFTDEEIAGFITIGKSKMLDAAGEKAPPRGKGKYQAALMQQLEDIGAVTKKTIQKLMEKKA